MINTKIVEILNSYSNDERIDILCKVRAGRKNELETFKAFKALEMCEALNFSILKKKVNTLGVIRTVKDGGRTANVYC